MEFGEENVLLDVSTDSKEKLFDKIASYAQKLRFVSDADKVSQSFRKREQEFSTGLQDGFAIPHAKSPYVISPTVFFIQLKKPISWETLDNQDVNCVFALLVPKDNEGTLYLQMLSNLSQALLEEEFINRLKQDSSKKEFVTLINKEMIGEESK